MIVECGIRTAAFQMFADPAGNGDSTFDAVEDYSMFGKPTPPAIAL